MALLMVASASALEVPFVEEHVFPLNNESRTFEAPDFDLRLAEALRDIPGVYGGFQPRGIGSPRTSLEVHGPRGLPQFMIEGTIRTGALPFRTFMKGDLSIAPFLGCENGSPGYRLTMTLEDSPSWIQGNAERIYGDLCKSGATTWTFATFMVQGPHPQWAVAGKLRALLAQQSEPLFDAIVKRAQRDAERWTTLE